MTTRRTMPDDTIHFNNAYEQVSHFIEHFDLSGGYIGAGGMGFENDIELTDEAPDWAHESKVNIITQLSQIHNYYYAEFVSITLRKLSNSVHLKTSLRSGCDSLPIGNYPKFKEELLQVLNCPAGSEVPYSDQWDHFCWDRTNWENVFYYDPTEDDYVEVKMDKTRTTKLTRLVKRYVPHNENFRRIDELELCLYKHQGSVIVKSAETKWSDITNELLMEKPY